MTFAAAIGFAALPAWAEPKLTLLSNLTWDEPHAWFGGLSGLEVSENGTDLTLITDRGTLVHARLERDGGRIEQVKLLSYQQMKTAAGAALPTDNKDTEGLAIAASGRAFVSFETKDRVEMLDFATGRLAPLPAHPDFSRFRKNTGLEALAVHPDGRLFAVSEGAGDAAQTTALYVFADGKWRITHRIPLQKPFRPVGADFDTDGVLYLLERTVTPLGFRSQIRRFDLNTVPSVIETLLTTFPSAFDNLEALSVWKDDAGLTRLTLVSDDNFLSLQTTQIVEFLLSE